ncbi:MAG: GNAT family N-acetyltransferase [Phycisphaerales bacterium]|nr:GNAT family N-acetyltransferase [Phycisphaerales bacterium]
MSTPLNYGGVTEADLPALSRIMQHAFAGDAESCTKWLVAAGIEHLRAVRSGNAGAVGGAIRGSLLRIPMGQFFAGRSVSMLGIAGVGVPPEARGSGVARAMMGDALREAHEDGFALSALYASTQALYRQVGYEQAGFQFRTRIPVRQIDVRPPAAKTPSVRPLTPDDENDVRDCYRDFATNFSGPLDRGPYVWRRTREWRDKSYSGFGVSEGRSLEGYVFLAQEQGENIYGKHDVLISDIAFTTPRAARRLLGFLADFATMGESIVLQCGPLHPLISLTNAIMLKIEKQEYWMLRIVNVPKALEQRGYHPAARGVVQLDLHDETIPANSGSWTLAVERGQATVKKENQIRPTIRTTTQALAPLYTGLYTARQLRLMGWLEGDDAAIDAADGLFMGTMPWMSDFF